jgi:hypothetical protein
VRAACAFATKAEKFSAEKKKKTGYATKQFRTGKVCFALRAREVLTPFVFFFCHAPLELLRSCVFLPKHTYYIDMTMCQPFFFFFPLF